LKTFSTKSSHNDFAFHCISSFTNCHELQAAFQASQRMEADLNKSSFYQRGSGRTTMSLIRLWWNQQLSSPRPATRLVGWPLLHSPWPATRLARWPHQDSLFHSRRGMLPPSQTPQRAHSTTGHMLACEVPTPRGMSMGRTTVAIQPPGSTHRWSTMTRLPPGRSINIRYRGRPRGHQPMGTRMAVLAPKPEAQAFGHPLTAEREREPILARPRTNRGLHGEDGAPFGGFNSRTSNVDRAPSSAVLSG
jgi:hypothetical protein